MKEKLEYLKGIIKEKDNLMIAFSGGVDSYLFVMGRKSVSNKLY